ncbi:hypothetical protein DSO57_1011983 [Entomophthora muscae]|uniref:Uncharacterized protein n=1 Tax=Entomophthora muscae TaxID=34485 RepID=A0ACC2TGR9_9FUNG|nr:hypothetical protein DSO57_1011983 [Entomophthora muscae]
MMQPKGYWLGKSSWLPRLPATNFLVLLDSYTLPSLPQVNQDIPFPLWPQNSRPKIPIHFTVSAVPFKALDNTWVVLCDWSVQSTPMSSPSLLVSSLPRFLKEVDSSLKLGLFSQSQSFCVLSKKDLEELPFSETMPISPSKHVLVAKIKAKSPLIWTGSGVRFILQINPVDSFMGEPAGGTWFIEIRGTSFASYHPGFLVRKVVGFRSLRRKGHTFHLENLDAIDDLDPRFPDPPLALLSNWLIEPRSSGASLDVTIVKVLNPHLRLYMVEHHVLLCLGADSTSPAIHQLCYKTRLRIDNFHWQASPTYLETIAKGGILLPCVRSNWALLEPVVDSIENLSAHQPHFLSCKLALPGEMLQLFYMFENAKLNCPSCSHSSLFQALSEFVMELVDKPPSRTPVREFLLHADLCPGRHPLPPLQIPTLNSFASLDWKAKETKHVTHSSLLGWLDVTDGTWVFHVCSHPPVTFPCLMIDSSGVPTSIISPALIQSLWLVPHFHITRENHGFGNNQYLLYLPLNSSKCLLAPKFSPVLTVFVPKQMSYSRLSHVWQGLSLALDGFLHPERSDFVPSLLNFSSEMGTKLNLCLVPSIPVYIWATSQEAPNLEPVLGPHNEKIISRLLSSPIDILPTLKDQITFQSIHQIINTVPIYHSGSTVPTNTYLYGVVRQCSSIEEDITWFHGPAKEPLSSKHKLHIVLQDTVFQSSLLIYLTPTHPPSQYVFPGQLLTLCNISLHPSKSGKVYGHFGASSRLHVGLPPNANVSRYPSRSFFPSDPYQPLTPSDLFSVPFKYIIDFQNVHQTQTPPRGVFRVTAKVTKIVTLTFKYPITPSIHPLPQESEAKVSGFMIAYLSDGSGSPIRTIADDIPTIFSLLQLGIPYAAIPDLLDEMVSKLSPEPFHYQLFDAPISFLNEETGTARTFYKKIYAALNQMNSSIRVAPETWDLAVEPRYPVKEASQDRPYLQPNLSNQSMPRPTSPLTSGGDPTPL